MCFAFQYVPEPVDVSDYSSDRKDPDDPGVRWLDDISSLEYSSGKLPFPEDTSDRAQAHRQRKSDTHDRHAANMRQLINWMHANGRSPKPARNSEHSGTSAISI